MLPEKSQQLQELLSWQPEYGVLSVVVVIEAGDRREKWRIQLKNYFAEITEQAHSLDHKGQRALKKAVAAVYQHLEAHLEHGRTHVGFLEVGASQSETTARSEWLVSQLIADHTSVHFRPRSHLAPLLSLIERGRPRGVVALSGDLVRLFAWEDGELHQLEELELSLYSDTWRERKAHKNASNTSGTSSSGKDQHQQRLGANRQHFLRDSGARAAQLSSQYSWDELLVFGDAQYCQDFESGLVNGHQITVHHQDHHNVIHEDNAELLARVNKLIQESMHDREESLTAQALGHADHGAVLGVSKTAKALEVGRVEHLLLSGISNGHEQLSEELLEQALATSAEVTLLEQAPEPLEEYQGVAGLLRY